MCSMSGSDVHAFEGKGYNGLLCRRCGALLDMNGRIFPAKIIGPVTLRAERKKVK